MTVNDATGTDILNNCALCTVAAIFDTTSGDIARQCGSETQDEKVFVKYIVKKKGALKEAPNVATAQMLGIYDFIAEKSGKNPFCPVNLGQTVKWNVAKDFMNKQPNGTEFAIYGNGFDEDDGCGAHWFYGVKKSDGVKFKDFQMDNGKTKAEESDKPWAPKGKHFETDSEADDDLNQYFVIAISL